jgi:cyclophilin family peptidyl-prolyl cis-trans isomerase
MNAPRFTRQLLAACAMLLSLPLSAQTTSTPVALPNATPAPESSAGTGPRVALDTSMGRIVVELYPDKSPRTVANFLRYVRDGHYNGTVFHRVIADLLIQGGAFTPDLEHKPERAPVANEANNGLSNLRGTLSAARRPSTKDSAAAQFFINTVDNRQFDYHGDAIPQQTGYCVFGRVVEGIEVVDKIRVVATAARKPFNADVPATAVVIERASIIEP